MEYALLFYHDASKLDEDHLEALAGEMAVLRDELKEAGIWRASARLSPPETATTQAVRDGRVLITDGPFSDTKEYLAGLFVIECEDLEAALEIAARVPLARHGSVEIRPTRSCPG